MTDDPVARTLLRVAGYNNPNIALPRRRELSRSPLPGGHLPRRLNNFLDSIRSPPAHPCYSGIERINPCP
jgi:hypothetical protein